MHNVYIFHSTATAYVYTHTLLLLSQSHAPAYILTDCCSYNSSSTSSQKLPYTTLDFLRHFHFHWIFSPRRQCRRWAQRKTRIINKTHHWRLITFIAATTRVSDRGTLRLSLTHSSHLQTSTIVDLSASVDQGQIPTSLSSLKMIDTSQLII